MDKETMWYLFKLVVLVIALAVASCIDFIG